MYKNFRFLYLLLFVSLGGLVFGALFDRPEGDGVQLEWKESISTAWDEGNAPKPRTWREFPKLRLSSLDDPEETTLYGHLLLEVDDRDHLFVVDYGDLKIKEFTDAGQLVREYGKGRGQGPGEFGSITDVDVQREGEVIVADPVNGRITFFDREGEVDHFRATKRRPYRMVDGGGGDLILMFHPGESPHLFGRLNREGEMVRTFGDFLEGKASRSVIMDGRIESDGRGGFFYMSFYTGILAAFDDKDQLRFLSSLIARKDPPEVFSGPDGKVRLDPRAPIRTVNLSVVGEEVYVVSWFEEGFARAGVIDIYGTEDGSYRHSLKIPETCNWLIAKEDGIYTVNNVTITKWANPITEIQTASNLGGELASDRSEDLQ